MGPYNGSMQAKKLLVLSAPLILVGVGLGLQFGIGIGMAAAGLLLFADLYILGGR